MADVTEETHEEAIFDDYMDESAGTETPQDEPSDPETATPRSIRDRAAALIDVKSIITIMAISTLCIMEITGREPSQAFLTVLTAVTTYFFSRPSRK